MLRLDLVQEVMVDAEKCARTDCQSNTFHNSRDLCSRAPHAMLLRVDTDECRDETSQTIGNTRQEELVEQPHKILHVSPREYRHANGRNRAHDCRNDQQRNILDALEDLLGRLICPIFAIFVLDGFLDCREGTGKHNETGKEEPDEERSEDVV